jgi:hypothetical protein
MSDALLFNFCWSSAQCCTTCSTIIYGQSQETVADHVYARLRLSRCKTEAYMASSVPRKPLVVLFLANGQSVTA